MNLDKILGEIEKHDPEVYNKLDTRRHAMKSFARVGGRVALAAVPLALGAMFQKSYAQTPGSATILNVLNYALTLEYLEAEFYATAVTKFAQIGVPAGAAQAAITKLANDESAHVIFLKTAITAGFGASSVTPKPTFDLTGGNGSGTGPFAMAFSNYGLFLAVAQTFEDTGVRAYKGRAQELVGGGDYLTAALNIHSVEARHAAHIRSMRNALNIASGNAVSLVPSGVTVKPWITLSQSGIDTPAVQASYDGAVPESTTTQAGVAITGIAPGITTTAASESFDEPLTAAEVLAIIDPFIV